MRDVLYSETVVCFHEIKVFDDCFSMVNFGREVDVSVFRFWKGKRSKY